MTRIVTINAGGRRFQAYLSTLLRYPNTRFARLFDACRAQPPAAAATTHATDRTTAHAPAPCDMAAACDAEVFVDVSPDAFDHILCFLRTNAMQLPVDNELVRRQVVHCLHAWDLVSYAFPPTAVTSTGAGDERANAVDGGDGGAAAVRLPDVCAVQVCDHMQHDQGMKRHALTITYGADGCQLRRLTQRIRGDLHTQLSSTYWQCYQTNERAVFFTTTKVANGAADLMTTSITQQLIEHTEQLGYRLVSSYVTLSPDVMHTSVRMLIHHFIFRRQRLPMLDVADDIDGDEAAAADDDAVVEDEEETFSNFAPRPVGPQKVVWDSSATIPDKDRSRDFWPTTTTTTTTRPTA